MARSTIIFKSESEISSLSNAFDTSKAMSVIDILSIFSKKEAGKIGMIFGIYKPLSDGKPLKTASSNDTSGL